MVVTRFAPSPTGMLHIGGVRTALFSWLYARRTGGKFILRIEDTDRERSTDEAVQVILQGMQWLNLNHDEGPHFQSARFPRYREVLEQLIAGGKAYRCYCTKGELEQLRSEQIASKQKPRYDGRCRDRTDSRPGTDPVVRFRNPVEGEVIVDDLVHGRVIFRNSELDDLVLARADGSPTYNFCVVVDDIDMGVTHVIRGDDHLNNTPRQINMFEALGTKIPVFAHVSMILGADGTKLSKRHGAVSVLQYEEEGYLPDALLNYLIRLGWSHGDQEIFTREEMVSLFDIENVNKAASAFNPEKLLWLNQQHMIRGNPKAIVPFLTRQLDRLGISDTSEVELERVVIAQRERCKTIKDMADSSRFFFGPSVEIDRKASEKHLSADALDALDELVGHLDALPEWTPAMIHSSVSGLATDRSVSLGKIAQPLRVAVTGSTVSPPIDQTLSILGKVRTLARLRAVMS